ncbi:hypothetical protein [Melittangium boletus]|uniref:Uncharacterized protein n=1 Tax=Melittangium boletus DSM 14713 TaxID=1294270 RepID=A0A250IMW3_9BACT|nr:hypothetical protein [Melittangium boletus]ATB32590.1 hypothetical protein MEBOL_006078 [Melittangium boletus DSM 14713]
MADETAEFVKDPWSYIRNKLVNNSRPVQAIWCTLAGPDAKKSANATEFLSVLDSGLVNMMEFQFVPVVYKGTTNVMLRPNIENFFSISNNRLDAEVEIEINQTQRKVNLAKIHQRYNSQVPMLWKWSAAWPSAIKAYYFPYKTGGIKKPEHMGFVDFPRQNPPHKFVFTGGMNGCHLVVTDSPLGEKFLRAWHYQSASSNPVYLPKQLGTGKFPRKVYDWLTHEEYEFVPGRQFNKARTEVFNDEVNGFNFLHYHDDDNSWWLYSQPQKICQDSYSNPPATYVTKSRQQPFRRKIVVT